MRKKTIGMFMILLAFGLFITGCSSDKQFVPDDRGRFREGFSEEQRQQMFEEMQQKAVDACFGKVEGDSCTIEGGRGEMQGTCSVENANLLCRFERPEMPFRPMPE